MIKSILRWLMIALFGLLVVLVVNTLRSKPWPVYPSDAALYPLPDSAIRHMSQAIQIPTISVNDSAALDSAAFHTFGVFLRRSYPLLHQHLTQTVIRQFSYVYEWKGRDTSLRPIVLMGHYDVVPVEAPAQWRVPPFSGTITDSCIWGRGAVDDKFGVIAILEATEALLRKGFVPRRTIFLCFGHDEEIRGPSAGPVAQYLDQLGVRAEMVLDEGGEISVSKTKEIGRPVAVIGIGEKGYASFELSVNKEGGHSSIPEKETAIDILSTALHKLRTTTPPSRLTPPVREFLTRIGSSSNNFLHRMAATNLWLFDGTARSILSTQPEGSALVHTTIVPTVLMAGIKDNVVPTTATAIVNTRILPGETSLNVEDFIRTAIADDRVKIKKTGRFSSEPSPVTSLASPALKRLESAIYRTIPNVLPAPYLMTGGTDSRFYRRISDGVVNFFPQTEGKGVHGINERLPIPDLQRGIHFITAIIEESDRSF